MRIVLALLAGAVAWMAVAASHSQAPGTARRSAGVRQPGSAMPPGHYNRLASYYRVHLN